MLRISKRRMAEKQGIGHGSTSKRKVLKVAHLIQDFSGQYHIKVNGLIECFSVPLKKAQEWATKNNINLY